MNISMLRNIGIIAHIDAGKTTFSERILYYANVIHRMGEVHEGAATMDFLPEEQERGITIASACISCRWGEYAINLVDTPGHVDFTVEVERCLRVLDGAVGIFCAVGGVEPQSETVWHQADAFAVPRLAVINKMDRVGASFSNVLQAMQDRLHVRPLPVTVPVGEGESFCAVLDIVREKRIEFDVADQGKTPRSIDYSPEDAALAAPYREALLDLLTETDDNLLELALAGEPLAPERLDATLRSAVAKGQCVPVFAASALRNIGVQPVLDGICRYLPSPLEASSIPAVHGADETTVGTESRLACDPDAPVCALAFKVIMEGSRKVVFLRIYAGTLHEGDTVLNMTTGGRVRVQRLFRLHADQKEQLDKGVAGDIVAVLGLKDVRTGDTLAAEERPLLLEPIRHFTPVISLAFEPKNMEEADRLDEALAAIAEEDPTLTVVFDEATGQRLVSGMGELHLDVVAERLQRQFSLEPRVGKPQVVCRATVSAASAGVGEFDRELGGVHHYGRVTVAVEPGRRGTGVTVRFTFDTSGWPQELLDAVDSGVQAAVAAGVSGYAVDDVIIAVTDVDKKEGKATTAGVHMAAQNACAAAFVNAAPILLEPLMQLTVIVPEDFLGAAMSLLGTRGVKVENLVDRVGCAHQKSISAIAPLREMFGFATALRSVSQGRASFVMQFMRFDALSGRAAN